MASNDPKTSVVLLDDEPYALHSLSKGLSLCEDVVVSAAFSDAREAVQYLLGHKPDLLFLDIRMPGLNGFDVLDILGANGPEVIFVTSYDEYAIKAIRYSALDYLLKPVDQNALREALRRYHLRKERVMTQLRLSNLQHNLGTPRGLDLRLVFQTKQGEKQFPAKEIVRCEAESNYSWIHLVDGKKFLASKTLSDVENMLDGEVFLRIHKSHIVNTSHIQRFPQDDTLLMSDGTALTISRRRLAEVKTKLRNSLHP